MEIYVIIVRARAVRLGTRRGSLMTLHARCDPRRTAAFQVEHTGTYLRDTPLRLICRGIDIVTQPSDANGWGNWRTKRNAGGPQPLNTLSAPQSRR